MTLSLLSAAREVHDKFKRDIEQGFVTRDKTYAVELLGKALSSNDLALDALRKSLIEMVRVYGDMDGVGTPIKIIADAVKAIRLVDPKFKFEDY